MSILFEVSQDQGHAKAVSAVLDTSVQCRYLHARILVLSRVQQVEHRRQLIRIQVVVPAVKGSALDTVHSCIQAFSMLREQMLRCSLLCRVSWCRQLMVGFRQYTVGGDKQITDHSPVDVQLVEARGADDVVVGLGLRVGVLPLVQRVPQLVVELVKVQPAPSTHRRAQCTQHTPSGTECSDPASSGQQMCTMVGAPKSTGP
jgi:hypothetical protein